MNIVFCDIDGVLNDRDDFEHPDLLKPRVEYVLDAPPVAKHQLDALIWYINTFNYNTLVWHTSWRSFWLSDTLTKLAPVIEYIKKHCDISFDVVDVTIDDRADAIDDYLSKHNVESYVIFEDEPHTIAHHHNRELIKHTHITNSLNGGIDTYIKTRIKKQ
jgi:hypothetical protein